MSHRERIVPLAALVVVLSLAAPGAAHGCWDGYYASIGRVDLMGGDDRWDPDRARHLAIWLSRIDALVPEEGSVMIEHGFLTVCRDGSACGEHRWNGRNLARLFRLVADALGSTRAEIHRARALTPETWTVQIAASRDRDDAARIAERLNASDHGDHGFYEAGGFPAINPRAHVVTATSSAGETLYRVVVGAFDSRGAADAHAAELRSTLGAETLVRAL